MKLDLDVVRSILLAVECAPPNQPPGRIAVEGVSEDEVLEYIELLADQGLVLAKVLKSGTGQRRIAAAHVERLTWAGHEFLSNAKNATVWEKTKAEGMVKGGAISFEILKSLLIKVAAQHFGVGSA